MLQSFYIAVSSELFEHEGWKVVVLRDLLESSIQLGQNMGQFGSYLVCTANPLIQVNEIYICYTIS